MEDYYQLLSEHEKEIFSTLREFAFQLGYKAKKDKTNTLGYTFHHNKVKKTILRFSSQGGRPILRIKFFATKNYSNFFQEAIRRTIEEYDYRYTGCYGCNNNCGSTQGYSYRYEDGRTYYRCGMELIEIKDIANLPLTETIELLKNQHEYFLRMEVKT